MRTRYLKPWILGPVGYLLALAASVLVLTLVARATTSSAAADLSWVVVVVPPPSAPSSPSSAVVRAADRHVRGGWRRPAGGPQPRRGWRIRRSGPRARRDGGARRARLRPSSRHALAGPAPWPTPRRPPEPPLVSTSRNPGRWTAALVAGIAAALLSGCSAAELPTPDGYVRHEAGALSVAVPTAWQSVDGTTATWPTGWADAAPDAATYVLTASPEFGTGVPSPASRPSGRVRRSGGLHGLRLAEVDQPGADRHARDRPQQLHLHRPGRRGVPGRLLGSREPGHRSHRRPAAHREDAARRPRGRHRGEHPGDRRRRGGGRREEARPTIGVGRRGRGRAGFQGAEALFKNLPRPGGTASGGSASAPAAATPPSRPRSAKPSPPHPGPADAGRGCTRDPGGVGHRVGAGPGEPAGRPQPPAARGRAALRGAAADRRRGRVRARPAC